MDEGVIETTSEQAIPKPTIIEGLPEASSEQDCSLSAKRPSKTLSQRYTEKMEAFNEKRRRGEIPHRIKPGRKKVKNKHIKQKVNKRIKQIVERLGGRDGLGPDVENYLTSLSISLTILLLAQEELDHKGLNIKDGKNASRFVQISASHTQNLDRVTKILVAYEKSIGGGRKSSLQEVLQDLSKEEGPGQG
jgi:hypothetical protein